MIKGVLDGICRGVTTSYAELACVTRADEEETGVRLPAHPGPGRAWVARAVPRLAREER